MTSIVSTEHLEDLQKAIQSIMDQNLDQALEIIQAILAKDPQVPEALHLLGLCSVLLNDIGRGIELITNAHELDGECREYADSLASLLAQTGNLNESLYFAKLSTTLEPHPELTNLMPASMQDYARALASAQTPPYHLEAMLHFAHRDFGAAADVCEKALRLNPEQVEVLRILGQSLTEIGEYPRALAALHAAEQIKPGHIETSTALARCLILQGQNDDALACFDDARRQDKEDLSVPAAHLHALSFMDDERWQTRAHVEDIFITRAKAMKIEAMDGGDPPPEGKIRIGILSDAFYNCDTGLVLETFLKNYNRTRFEVFCFQQSITNDPMTDQFKTLCESWRPVFDLDDWILANIISGDGIQALIDITGYGPGQRRAPLTAKPAPLQVAWLNHLDGTGKDAINLILADAATLDTDRSTALAGQDVAELETGLIAFEEFGLMGNIDPLPALEHNTITFGAFADLSRVSPHTALTWSRILKAVPNSLLVLSVRPNLPAEIRAALTARFAHFGVTSRIAFMSNEPASDTTAHHNPEQEFFAGIDILLDAPVQTKAARVARALWMGIPVLTQNTGRRSGQIAASVLMAADRKSWIAKSSDELVTTAQELAGDLKALSDTRQSLRDTLKESQLFKGRDLAREIETAIEMALEDLENG